MPNAIGQFARYRVVAQATDGWYETVADFEDLDRALEYAILRDGLQEPKLLKFRVWDCIDGGWQN